MNGIWEKILGHDTGLTNESNTSELAVGIDQTLSMRLSQFAYRNLAVKIYSEILGCELWLCSNVEMASQVKQDDPEAITYTIDEMRELIRRNPTPEDLKLIHNVKSIFEGSKIVNSQP